MRAAIAAVAAVAISGCGAANAVKEAVDPVAKAADVTGKVQGYKVSADMTVSTPAGQVSATISGDMDRANHTGQMTARESVAGQTMTIAERFSGLSFYMDTSGLPGADQLTHGKRWLKMDMARTLGSMGLGSLSTTGSDPSQFVDYLRATGANTEKLGSDTIRGVAATHYHAVADLNKYVNLVPQADRAAAEQGISTLKTALGTHTMAMDVWIDGQKLVRRLKFGVPECVNSQKLSLNMTMDLYDYGPQPATQVPSDSDAYDITPLLSAAMKNTKTGCGTSN